MSIVLYGLAVFWFSVCVCMKWKLEEERALNQELQDENSDLIARNEKIDTYLDETRAVVITQNKIINELQNKL